MVSEAASDAYSAAWRWGDRTRFGEDDNEFYELQEDYDNYEAELLARIRADLSIPEN